jgi:cytochrome c553
MKKTWLWICIAAAIGLLVVVLGPDLLGLYRLTNYVAAQNKTYEAAGAWPQVVDDCKLCHMSVSERYPNLAGQPAPYLAAQLHDFASEKRVNPLMSSLAKTLSASDIENISKYFSSLPPGQNPYFAPDRALWQTGKDLVASKNCAACHGDRLMGHDQYPRLAGQGYDYLVSQLDAFASGHREDRTGAMNGLAASLSPKEREAVATFLASRLQEKK